MVTDTLMERFYEPRNLNRTHTRVKANRGGPGVDDEGWWTGRLRILTCPPGGVHIRASESPDAHECATADAAGVADHMWTLEEVMGLLEVKEAGKTGTT